MYHSLRVGLLYSCYCMHCGCGSNIVRLGLPGLDWRAFRYHARKIVRIQREREKFIRQTITARRASRRLAGHLCRSPT